MALYIGLMSGTSLDGIDAALVEINPSKTPKLIEFYPLPLPQDLKEKLYQLNLTPEISLYELAELQKSVANEFSKATLTLLEKAKVQAKDITAIGSHGQTIFHAPEIPMSLQIGHPAFIAKQTGITTVGDFRVDDMANGGQGAPLAPAFHQQLFETGTALVNIGGISNITMIDDNLSFGFDIGPGNGLMDEVCQNLLNINYDDQGQIAAENPVDVALLNKLEAHPYFEQAYPKSTGRETFNLDWLSAHASDQTPEVLLSTLNQLTANTIANCVNQQEHKPQQLLLCGGGASNLTLKNRIQSLLEIPVKTTDEVGILADGLEAMMCAWLAQQRLHNQSISLTAITGAKKDSVLGGIFHP